MTEQLLPCPFCGGRARAYDYDTELDAWPVSCDNRECGAEVTDPNSPDAARARWNRRVPQKPRKQASLPAGWQELTFPIQQDGVQTEWHLHAPVFGVWAVHRPHPDEAQPDYWHVTHAPTGTATLRIANDDLAVLAAKRLAEIEPPVVTIVIDADGRKYAKPLPGEWVEQAALTLADLGEWQPSGNRLCAPRQLFDAIRRINTSAFAPCGADLTEQPTP